MDEERHDDGDEDSGTGHGVTDFGSTRPSSRCVHRFVIDIHPPIYFLSKSRFAHLFLHNDKFRLACKRQSGIGERGERGRTVGMLVISSLVISGECVLSFLCLFLDLVTVSVATCLPLSWLQPSIFILILTSTPLCADQVANHVLGSWTVRISSVDRFHLA
jgi:hypothetical protein